MSEDKYPAYSTQEERERYRRWEILAYLPNAGNRVWDMMRLSDQETEQEKAHWPVVEFKKRLGEPDWVRITVDGVVQIEGQVNAMLTQPRPAWRCTQCGSEEWVGYRAYPGATRLAQCVPCGHVQPTPPGA